MTKTLTLTLALVVAIATVSAGQSDGASIAGSWTAQFEGRTFLRLELKTENGTITGALGIGNFEVDRQGEVTRADESPRSLAPISDVKRRASILTFSRKDGDGIDRFEVRLLDATNAELNILLDDEERKQLAESGVPIPKPIHLAKQ